MEINFILSTADLLSLKGIGEKITFNSYFSTGNLCVSLCMFVLNLGYIVRLLLDT